MGNSSLFSYVLFAFTRLSAQQSADAQQRPADILENWTTVRFHEDGSSEHEEQLRVHVNTGDGVRQMQQLTFPHDPDREQIELRSLRVEKADGTVQTAGPEAIAEVPPSAAYAAGAKDHAVTRITAAALAPGDVLVADIVKHVKSVDATGNFWYEHDFRKGVAVLDERLTIEVPATRNVQLYSFDPHFTKSVKDGKTIYEWKRSNTAPVFNEAGEDRMGPDVQVSSFTEWTTLAKWYGNLVNSAADASAVVNAKAIELTKDLHTPKEKVSALYDFVSLQISTTHDPISINEYRMHPAETILTQHAGNGAEKHALLVAMLSAIGIPSDTALLGSSRTFHPDLPIPTQFDHAITTVRLGEERFWLETSLDVAPFGLLNSRIRGIHGLLITPSGKSELVQSPPDPPFRQSQLVEMDDTVSDLGKLTKTIHYHFRGDKEVGLRYYFRKTPSEKWKGIGENLMRFDGLRGTIVSVKPGDVLNTHEPLGIDIVATEPAYLNWSAAKDSLKIPMTVLQMPGMPLKTTLPGILGSPMDITVKLKLTLPAGYKIKPPAAAKVHRSYLDYKTTYSVNGSVLTVERQVHYNEREIPAAQAEDYSAFNTELEKDENSIIEVERTTPAGVPQSATADELQESAHEALRARQSQNAIQLLQRVLQIDPQHKDTYYLLAQGYLYADQRDAAVDALHKQLEQQPKDEKTWRDLGSTLAQLQKFDEAIAAYQKLLEIKPQDAIAHRMIGGIYLDQQKYALAVPELEQAEAATPGNTLQEQALGRAYLNVGRTDDALKIYAKAATTSPNAQTKLAIASDFLAKGVLDHAQEYADAAVQASNKDLLETDPSSIIQWQLSRPIQLAACWDTQGWIYFQRGMLDKAEPPLRSAWDLAHDPANGKHLQQLYEKLGKKNQAAQIRAALDAGTTPPETPYPVGKLTSAAAKADFYVILAPGEKSASVLDVHFISGSDALKDAGDKIRAIDFGKVFADSSPSKIIRRGTLSCTATGDCTFTFLAPQAVQSLQ